MTFPIGPQQAWRPWKVCCALLLAEWEVGVSCGPNPACGARVNKEGCHIVPGRLPTYPLGLSSEYHVDMVVPKG